MDGLIWLVIMAGLLIIELLTLGLTTIWFAAGAFFAFVISLFAIGIVGQIVVFAIVSIILLIFTRPIAVKYLNSRTTKTNAEAIVGKTVRVTEHINNLKSEGQVVVDGMEWTARSSDDRITFNKDELVKVVAIEGVKLIVEGQKGE